MSEIRELTLTDKKKLEAELAELVEAKKKVAEDIQTARGFGDLSENAEYDAAKAKEAEVYGNIAASSRFCAPPPSSMSPPQPPMQLPSAPWFACWIWNMTRKMNIPS